MHAHQHGVGVVSVYLLGPEPLAHSRGCRAAGACAGGCSRPRSPSDSSSGGPARCVTVVCTYIIYEGWALPRCAGSSPLTLRARPFGWHQAKADSVRARRTLCMLCAVHARYTCGRCAHTTVVVPVDVLRLTLVGVLHAAHTGCSSACNHLVHAPSVDRLIEPLVRVSRRVCCAAAFLRGGAPGPTRACARACRARLCAIRSYVCAARLVPALPVVGVGQHARICVPMHPRTRARPCSHAPMRHSARASTHPCTYAYWCSQAGGEAGGDAHKHGHSRPSGSSACYSVPVPPRGVLGMG